VPILCRLNSERTFTGIETRMGLRLFASPVRASLMFMGSKMKAPVFLFSFSVSVLWGQSISVTTPTASSTIGKITTLTCSVSTITSLASVEYDVDSETVAFVRASVANECPSFQWNTAEIANGSHNFAVVARDAVNNVLAISSVVTATVDNSKICSNGTGTYDAQPTITPSTAVTSPWSTDVTFTVSLSGTTCATGNTSINWYAFVDGKQVATLQGTSSGSMTVHTQQFYNASHLVSAVAYQGNSTDQMLGSWQNPISFSNTGGNLAAVEMNMSASEVFLTPTAGSNSATLTATEFESDGSSVSRTPTIYNNNASVATVSGLTITSAALGATNMWAVDPWMVDTNFSLTSGMALTQIKNTVHQLPSYAGGWSAGVQGGWCFIAPSGSNWISGLYHVIGSVLSSGNEIITLDRNVATGASSGGTGTFGPCKEIWAFVNTNTNVPHFSRVGTIRTSYDANASFYSSSIFNAGGGQYSYANFEQDYVDAGWSTMELTYCSPGAGYSAPPPGDPSGLLIFSTCGTNASTQAAWQTAITNKVNTFAAHAQQYGYYFRLVLTAWTKGDTALYSTVKGTGSTWSPAAFQDLFQHFAATNASCVPSATNHCYGSLISSSMGDEIDGAAGSLPLPGALFNSASNCGKLGGTCGPTQIVANGGTCTVTYPGFGLNASYNFIISGATTPGFNSVSPNVYAASGPTNPFTFPCPSVANGTYNASTDPNLSIQSQAAKWENSGTDFNNYTSYGTLMGWARAATPRTQFAWPTLGYSYDPSGANCTTLWNWQADPRMADYAELYDPGFTKLGPFRSHTFGYASYLARPDMFRAKLVCAPADGKPWLAQTQGVISSYTPVGYNLAVSSFSGDIITTTTPHGLSNIQPGISRLQLSGMSNSADNGVYFVRATPTANTIQVVWCGEDCSQPGNTKPTTSGATTLHFDNGDTRTWNIGNYGGQLFLGLSNQCNAADIGHTFTVSPGAGSSAFWATATGWFGTGSDAGCVSGNQQVFSVPNGSSTSGTVSIVPDNNYHYDYTIAGQIGGPRHVFLTEMQGYILGAAGMRSYQMGVDPALHDPISYYPGPNVVTSYINCWSCFTLDAGGDVQGGLLAQIDNGGSRPAWWAAAMPNLLMEREAACMLGARLASPDYGDGFMAAARKGASKTCLVVQSNWDSPRTLNVNLSSYLVSGQPIWKYYCEMFSGCTITQLGAGTNSDSVAFGIDGTVFYVFANSASQELSEPTVSARLADIPNATGWAIRYAYTPWPIGQAVSPGLVNIKDCGSASACTPPVDPALGTSRRYQIVYYNSNGVVAQSGVQQF
jgi:hypothetical protein